MATDNRKADSSNLSPEKQNEKIADLPTPQQSDKDAQDVKGGRMPLRPKGT